MAATRALIRLPRRSAACMVPCALSQDGLFQVDGTWGTVQPIQLAPGVRTVGELELIEQLGAGAALVDTRLPHFHRAGTIPGAVNLPHEQVLERIGELDPARPIPHEQVLERIDELDPARPAIFFCNGPQCEATPDAIRRLLDAGHPAARILYYRGGMHDWVTLGYPTEPGRTTA